jgi:hypothetical protein
MASLKPYKSLPDPEPLVKLADFTRRDDKRLEELLEEFIRNRDKGLDKSNEVK